jgi:hypothetical protein
MSHRVVQWGTGAIGSFTLKQIINNPQYELAGVYVYTDDKDGIDAGEIAGTAPTGIKATRSRDEILALDADVVLHMPRGQGTMDQHDEDVTALLRSGKNVVSTVGYASPYLHGADYAEQLEAAALAGGSTLFGTGIDPDFTLSRIPAMATGMCMDVSHIYLSEVADISVGSNAGTIIDIAGIGKDPATFTPDMDGAQYLLWIMPEVGDLLARNLGVEPDKGEEEFQILLATRDFEIPATPIKTGSIVGARYQRRVFWEGREFLHLDWYLTVQRDLPGFPPLADGSDARWTIEVDGAPSMRIVWDSLHSLSGTDHEAQNGLASWVYATGTVALRSIPGVVAGPPGLFKVPLFGAWNAQGPRFAK